MELEMALQSALVSEWVWQQVLALQSALATEWVWQQVLGTALAKAQ
jgi:hypothetical protein